MCRDIRNYGKLDRAEAFSESRSVRQWQHAARFAWPGSLLPAAGPEGDWVLQSSTIGRGSGILDFHLWSSPTRFPATNLFFESQDEHGKRRRTEMLDHRQQNKTHALNQFLDPEVPCGQTGKSCQFGRPETGEARGSVF